MLDADGKGTALVSRLAFLNPNRNPELDEGRAAQVLERELGIDRIVWLDTQVRGDDTDGHVDTYVRFVGPGKILVCLEPDGSDYVRVMGAIRDTCPSIEVIELPPPAPLVIHGDEVPASYANFYIANSAVLLPTFDQPGDAVAVEVFSEIFPDRTIVPIDCVELIWGLGAIHCLTCPVPAGGGKPAALPA